jgi:hypothetical protein
MKKLTLTLILILLISCSKKEKDFDSFEYSFAGTFTTVFSLKITDSDTIFLREEWNSGRNEGYKLLKPKTNYFAILTEQQKSEFIILLKNVDFTKINSEYFQDYLDGSAYNIIIRKDGFEKKVFVHSHKIPKELDTLSSWINITKQNLKLTKTNKQLHFESTFGMLPPPPPPPVKEILFKD